MYPGFPPYAGEKESKSIVGTPIPVSLRMPGKRKVKALSARQSKASGRKAVLEIYFSLIPPGTL
jgi:hypothetical protein